MMNNRFYGLLLAGTFLSTPALAEYTPTLDKLYAEGKSPIQSAFTLTETTETTGDDVYNIPDYDEATQTLTDHYYKLKMKDGVTSQTRLDNRADISANDLTGYWFDLTYNSSEYYDGGAAIKNTGTIGDVYGDFINDSVTSASSNPNGGAIWNGGTIGDIYGDFIGNSAIATGRYGSNGSAIFNKEDAIIGDIYGNFINNAENVIYNDYARIGNIHGNFIGNSGLVIYNTGSIDDIYGNFINNTSAVIDNEGTIGNIYGDFIGNSITATRYDSYPIGGIFDNYSTIGNIYGDFINNSVTSTSGNVVGGAIFNSYGTIGDIYGDFIGNNATTTGENNYAKGGAIYNRYDTITLVNSSFKDNYVKVSEYNDNASGGAIYNEYGTLNIKAQDGGESLFSGNYIADEQGYKDYQAIYMWSDDPSNTPTLNLYAKTKGSIVFDDKIGGTYALNIYGDGDEESFVKFNNEVSGADTVTLYNGSVTHLGLNGKISTKNLKTGDSNGVEPFAANNPILKVDVKLKDDKSGYDAGSINVSNDLEGDYSVIVNALTPETLQDLDLARTPFLFAPNDDESTASGFEVARVIGSPYLWDSEIVNDPTNGTTWYINQTLEDNPNYTPEPEPEPTPEPVKPVAPEVMAGIGLHEAAIEQTRSVVHNVRSKVSAEREYCPNCGIYDYAWNGSNLRNAWVLAQGESANIEKPADIDAKIWGIEAGLDIQNDVNNTFGVFASYRNGEYDLNGKGSKYHSTIGSDIEIDSWLAGLYYRYDKNMNWLFATLYGGIQQADVKTDDGIAKFDTDGIEFGASVEVGHTFVLANSLTLDPSLGVYYTQVNFDDANDNVGKEYSWNDIKHLEAELGAKLTKQFTDANVYVKPSVVQTLTKGDKVKITGLGKTDTYHDQTLGRIELGGRYGFTDALSAYAWTNYTFGSSYEAYALGAGLNYAW